jgi:hypothetical protein
MRSLFLRVMSMLYRYTGLHVYRISVRPLVRCPPESRFPGDITVRMVQPEELLKAVEDPELDMPADFVRGALARGDIAFGAFEGDRLVSYTWRTFTAAPYFDGLWARVDRPYQYTYKSFTLPAYRGRHIHVGITLFADTHLLERGYTAEVGFINVINFTSIGVAKYLGRQRIGYAGYVKLFGHRILFRTPSARRVGAELFEPHGLNAAALLPLTGASSGSV